MNKCSRKLKGQSRMDNTETLITYGTQDKGRRQTKQKIKRWATQTPQNTRDERMCSRRESVDICRLLKQVSTMQPLQKVKCFSTYLTFYTILVTVESCLLCCCLILSSFLYIFVCVVEFVLDLIMHEITAPTLCNHKLFKLVNRNKRTGQK